MNKKGYISIEVSVASAIVLSVSVIAAFNLLRASGSSLNVINSFITNAVLRG